MSQKTNRVNLDAIFYRYHEATRDGKGKILDGLCEIYNYNRKYLLQYFNGLTGKQ